MALQININEGTVLRSFLKLREGGLEKAWKELGYEGRSGLNYQLNKAKFDPEFISLLKTKLKVDLADVLNWYERTVLNPNVQYNAAGLQRKYPVFAEKLRHLRLLSKKTQKETADQLNIETTLYESWEDGKARPEGEWGSMLANMFNVSASDLFNEGLSCEAMMKNHDVDNSEVVIPIYGEHGAIATPNNGMVSDTGGQPSEYRRMARSLFDDAEAVLPVYGNSMTPNYPPSTELALKVDNSAPGYIDFGEVYVLELHGSDIPLFKRVLPSAIPGQVILASDNEMIRESGPFRGDYYYPPQPIDIDKVRRWWAVIGDQKRRKNKQIMLRGLREQQHQ